MNFRVNRKLNVKVQVRFFKTEIWFDFLKKAILQMFDNILNTHLVDSELTLTEVNVGVIVF